MLAWNYSGSYNVKRGIDEFDVYVVKQSDLDALSSALSFGDFFKEGTTIDDLLGSPLDLLTQVSAHASSPFSMTEAKVNDAGMDDYLFSDVAEGVAWVLLAPQSNHGATDYMGFGQIQFQGNETIANTPEPATWVMLLLGFGAVMFARRRRRCAE